MRLRKLTAVLLAVGLAAGPAAGADARTLHTVLQDDSLSLFSPASVRQFTATLGWLGVDQLRISAKWDLEAPAARARLRPAGFDAADPRAYDGSPGMQLLDAAVRAAAAGGLQVIIDPAFSAPLWATRDRQPRPGTDPWLNTDIDVRELAAWEGMLARRYGGSYVPQGATAPLPRVGTFTLWNEPNQQGYLAPQWNGAVPVSADWYRSLVELAYPTIKAASPGATVLLGNTSATGGSAAVGNSGVPPLKFIRRLVCVDAQLQPITDGPCRGFRELPGDGWAQHPYERNAPPWVGSGTDDPDGAEMGDLPRLQALLDRLVAMHRLAPAVANVWLTEQAYASNAQLTDEPWTESQQAQLDAAAEYLAWRDPQAESFSQFLLRDTLVTQTLALRARTGNPTAAVPGTWATGLERQDGTPKPALAMFRSPVVARPIPSTVPASWLPSSPAGAPAGLLEVWGRARPARQPTPVVVQVADGGSSAYRDAATTITDANGIFDTPVSVAAQAPVAIRFRWLAADGSWQTSPSVAPTEFPVS
jgi:hypothetical protein